MRSGKLGREWLFVLSALSAAASGLIGAGCGTSLNSSPAAPSGGTTQAQAQPPTGPKLGYVWDAANLSLRPVQGVAGASILGPATVIAPAQATAYVATATSAISGAALFLDANGGIYQSSLSGGAFTRIASVAGASSLLMSYSGSYALVTGRSASGAPIAAVITGLPGSPAVRNLDLSSWTAILGGAASDSGTVALAGSSGGGVAVVAFTGQSAGTQVGSAQSFGGMQFVPGTDTLVIGDGSSGAIRAIAHVSTAPASSVLSPEGGIAAPVALGVTSNARWVVAANSKGEVLRLDLTGAAVPNKVHCSCAPSGVIAMTGTTVRLVTAGTGPLWVVDAGSTAPRVLFVPSPTTPTTYTAKAATKAAL